MKIDLLSIMKMIGEEDKKLEENKTPVSQKNINNKVATLDLQGLFSLFEEIEPTLSHIKEEEDKKIIEGKSPQIIENKPKSIESQREEIYT